MGRVLIVLVALITMGTAAHATTLAAGAIFGGPTQNRAAASSLPQTQGGR